MHPVDNIRGASSHHLVGRRIVLGITGSIAAVKCVELARELIRHGADVVPVMTPAATRILHPDAMEFATGNEPILRLTGAVEHVSLLGDVPNKADLLLVAPATANTIAKMALGIDDSPVTTCVTVAIGTGTPVVVAPAMHEAMLDHPMVGAHVETLRSLGVTWVEPVHDEKKVKLAIVEAIAEVVLHRMANHPKKPGPLAGKRALVVSGSTAEPIDPVRILTNRSSGRSGHIIATELRRLGADVTLWQGHATAAVPVPLEHLTVPFSSHDDLSELVAGTDLTVFDQVWMSAAIGDYAAVPAKQKLPSGKKGVTLKLKPLPKIIEAVRRAAPKACLVAFKAESDAKVLLARAKERRKRYGAQFVVANTAEAFGATDTKILLVHAKGHEAMQGAKDEVLPTLVDVVAMASADLEPRKAQRRKATA